MLENEVDPREMGRKTKIIEYLAETLHGETRIETRMHSQCEVSVVIPAYAEREGIFRPLLSLARQEGVKPEQFEVIVVVNNPPSEPVRQADETQKDWERKRDLYLMATYQNEQTLLLIRSLTNSTISSESTEDERVFLDEIRSSGLKVYAIDKATNGQTLPETFANVGGARNRGVAEAVARFFEQKGTNGIVAQSDADVRFAPDYVVSLIRVFANDPVLIGIVGRMEFEKTAEMEALITSSSSFAQLLMHYRWVTECLKYGRTAKPLSRVWFSGGNMASRAFEVAIVGGVPKIAGGEDPAFGFRLAKIGKVEQVTEVLNHPLDRFSARTAASAGHGQHRLKLRDLIESGEMLVENPDAVKKFGEMQAELNRLKTEKIATIENIRRVITINGNALLSDSDIELMSQALSSGKEMNDLEHSYPHIRTIRASVDQRLAELYPNIPLDIAVERILVETTINDVIREEYEYKLRQLRDDEVKALHGREQFVRLLANLLRQTANRSEITKDNASFANFISEHAELLGEDAQRFAKKRVSEMFTFVRNIYAFGPDADTAVRALKESYPALFDLPENDPIRWTQMKLSALSRALE